MIIIMIMMIVVGKMMLIVGMGHIPISQPSSPCGGGGNVLGNHGGNSDVNHD